MRRLTLLLVLFLAVSAIPAHAQTDLPDTDGIPANCENATSPYADPNLFPRYAHGQLALIDWSSGAVVRVLETANAAPNFWLLGWSPDCHYLAGGLGDAERYTTILWDATSGAQIGTVADGYRRPHFLTWSPRGDALVVETRRGAFLWDLATGNRLQLTLDSSNGRSFRQINWNYGEGTLDTNMGGGMPIRFSLETGRPINLSLRDNQFVGSVYGTPSFFGLDSIVAAPNALSPYRCESFQSQYYNSSGTRFPDANLLASQGRLLLVDTITHETLQVLDTDYPQRGSWWPIGSLSPNCAMFFTRLPESDPTSWVVISIRDSGRVHSVLNVAPLFTCCALGRDRYQDWVPYFSDLPRDLWDSTGRYLFAQTYDGAQVWDSVTDSTFYVTSADESQRYGYSVDAVTWDVGNGRISVDMLYSDEVRVFDLATGQRVG